MQKQVIIAAPEFEKHVLGAVLFDNREASRVVAMLTTSDFFDMRHSAIFEAMQVMVLRGEPIDNLTLKEQLASMEKLREAGGEEYLVSIFNEVITAANVLQHTQVVKEKAVRRALRLSHLKAVDELEKSEYPLTEQIERTRNDLDTTATRGKALNGLKVVKRDLWVQQALESYNSPEYRGLDIGLEGLDLRYAKGLMQIVTGVPNHGKSEVVDAIQVGMARLHGWRTAFFSPENNPLHRHVQKITEKVAGASTYGASRMSFERFQYEVKGFVQEYFEFLDQGLAGATFDQILDEIERIRPAVHAAVVDPWNRLVVNKEEGAIETEYIRDKLSKGVRFAQQTGINLTIVAHPQKMRRDPKTQQLLKPNLYDISGSAHWYNITDNGLMVWRDFQAKRTEVHALKVRFKAHGTVGFANFGYNTLSGRYIPWALVEAEKAQRAAQGIDSGLPESDRDDFVKGVDLP